ncbi:hypothetical protein I1A_003090 [Pseudomonas fluorescens R124]|uniref:Uncharacterized protein n=1 Tax=Pseudomonas fluorescens R124 TaxID=743713 RepID=A0A7U9CSM1_PSEFL|nr:hypothetical protein [Pseudomonas fluorescens]EJZ58759.1 hypothetical protein I1A_003090 [Pseudomonas fluorescens R124]
MTPIKVTFRLYPVLVLKALVFFYLVGLLGSLIGGVIIYCKHGVWDFSGEDLLVSLRFSLVYGFFGGSGIWIFAKMEEIKRRKKEKV